jgi:hypothetical protein
MATLAAARQLLGADLGQASPDLDGEEISVFRAALGPGYRESE